MHSKGPNDLKPEVDVRSGRKIARGFANRMEEGERAPRVATPDLAERDFDYRSKIPILASDNTIHPSESIMSYLNDPKGRGC